MIFTHKMQRVDCLSHEIWPRVEKGWPTTSLDTHFVWGLGGDNVSKIKELEKNKQEWYYIDVGYLTEQITRYPTPKINDYDKTYFRIVKGGIHTIKGSEKGGQERLDDLRKKGIKCTFDNWNNEDGGHILICPSSETVTYKQNNMTQGAWIDSVVAKVKKITNRNIRIRNKPRPHNEWWKKPIQDDLNNCHCLITNMSLSAIDAVLEGVPIMCDTTNVAWPVSLGSISDIDFIKVSSKPTINSVKEWLKLLANNQFTLAEIENGKAFNILSNQFLKNV